MNSPIHFVTFSNYYYYYFYAKKRAKRTPPHVREL